MAHQRTQYNKKINPAGKKSTKTEPTRPRKAAHKPKKTTLNRAIALQRPNVPQRCSMIESTSSNTGSASTHQAGAKGVPRNGVAAMVRAVVQSSQRESLPRTARHSAINIKATASVNPWARRSPTPGNQASNREKVVGLGFARQLANKAARKGSSQVVLKKTEIPARMTVTIRKPPNTRQRFSVKVQKRIRTITRPTASRLNQANAIKAPASSSAPNSMARMAPKIRIA